MTPLVDLVCAWLGFVLLLVACCCVVWLWERVTGRRFDPLGSDLVGELERAFAAPSAEPRRWIA